jgi:hypothetical protein
LNFSFLPAVIILNFQCQGGRVTYCLSRHTHNIIKRKEMITWSYKSIPPNVGGMRGSGILLLPVCGLNLFLGRTIWAAHSIDLEKKWWNPQGSSPPTFTSLMCDAHLPPGCLGEEIVRIEANFILSLWMRKG